MVVVLRSAPASVHRRRNHPDDHRCLGSGVAPAERLGLEAEAVARAQPMPGVTDLDLQGARNNVAGFFGLARDALAKLGARRELTPDQFETTAQQRRKQFFHAAGFAWTKRAAALGAHDGAELAFVGAVSAEEQAYGHLELLGEGMQVLKRGGRQAALHLAQPADRAVHQVGQGGQRHPARLAQRANVAREHRARGIVRQYLARWRLRHENPFRIFIECDIYEKDKRNFICVAACRACGSFAIGASICGVFGRTA